MDQAILKSAGKPLVELHAQAAKDADPTDPDINDQVEALRKKVERLQKEVAQQEQNRTEELKSLLREVHDLQESVREFKEARHSIAKLVEEAAELKGYYFNASSAGDRPYCYKDVSISKLNFTHQVELEMQKKNSSGLVGTVRLHYLKLRIWALEAPFTNPRVGGLVFAVLLLFFLGTVTLLLCLFPAQRLQLDHLTKWQLVPEQVEAEVEAAFMLTVPWQVLLLCLVLGKLLGTDEVPFQSIWVPVVYFLPLLVRAVCLERMYNPAAVDEGGHLSRGLTGHLGRPTDVAPDQSLTTSRSFTYFSLDFVLSKLEIFDNVSDGAACAAAVFMASSAKERFIMSFQGGSAWCAGPMSAIGGLGSLMCIALLLLTLVQFGVLGASEGAPLEQAGLGEAARRKRAQNQEQRSVSLLVGTAVGENMPQFLLLGSLLMATGESLLVQPILMLSLSLTILGTAKGAMYVTTDAIHKLCSAAKEPDWLAARDHWGTAAAMLAFAVASWSFFVFGTLRIGMLQLCPCHTWGITTGCVPLSGH